MTLAESVDATTKRPRKKREIRKESNRRKLIEATIASIAEHGLAGTTVSTVIEKAELSRGIINLHFETKEALMVEALRCLVEEYYGAWNAILEDPNSSSAEKLKAMLLTEVDPVIADDKKLTAILCYYGDPHYQETHRTFFADDDQASLDRMTELCGELIEQGGYDGIDSERTAMALWSITDGLLPNRTYYPEVFDRQVCREVIRLTLNRFFPKHIGIDGKILVP